MVQYQCRPGVIQLLASLEAADVITCARLASLGRWKLSIILLELPAAQRSWNLVLYLPSVTKSRSWWLQVL